jgi:uncharacterized lipoprotein YmbA
MKARNARFIAQLRCDLAAWTVADVPSRKTTMVTLYRASGDAAGLAQIEATNRFYLPAIIGGKVELSEAIFARMEPMFTTYALNADMMALLDRAATAYADAAVHAAYWSLAGEDAKTLIARAMGKENEDEGDE